MTEESWYQQWFNSTYLKLYAHRNIAEAELQVSALLKNLPAMSGKKILDVGCGAGRHVHALKKHDLNVIGTDLSLCLLKHFTHGSRVCSDMRFLPFQNHSFNLITSFFSSFGYFEHPSDDYSVLQTFYNLLNSSGFLYLDLPNKNQVLNSLVPQSEECFEWGRVVQHRTFSEPILYKKIHIEKLDGKHEDYQECVRLYTYEQLKMMLESLHFSIKQIWGSEKGDIYDPNTSVRMSFLVQKS